MTRATIPEKPIVSKAAYFTAADRDVKMFSSGCTILDQVLGGGWPVGRISNIWGNKSSGKCRRNAFVTTPQGVVKLDDYGADLPYGATSIDLTLTLQGARTVRADTFWKEKVPGYYRVITASGEVIEATGKHKLQVLRKGLTTEMVRTDNLGVGNVLPLYVGQRLFPTEYVSLIHLKGEVAAQQSNPDAAWATMQLPDVLDENVASYLGLLAADGCVDEYYMQIAGHKPHSIKEQQRCLGAWTVLRGPHRGPNKPCREVLARLCGDASREHPAQHTAVPDLILKSPQSVQAAFLRSLLSLDGYELEWYTASAEMARQVRVMLQNFGVAVKTHVRAGAGAPGPSGELVHHDYYQFTVYAQHAHIFMREIGLLREYSVQHFRSPQSAFHIPGGGVLLREAITAAEVALDARPNGLCVEGTERRFPRTDCQAIPDDITGDFLLQKLQILEQVQDSVPGYDNLLKLARSETVRYDPICSIEYIEEEVDVFDVHVPEGHLFWCNGMINHNTLVAIEACANFAQEYPDSEIHYLESESAFDPRYAEALGLPLDRVVFGHDNPLGISDCTRTVEGLFEYLGKVLDIQEDRGDAAVPLLIVIDSLDAYSDRGEQQQAIDKGTYGAAKAKLLSQLFRRYISRLEHAGVTMLVVSQVRDKIGAMLGEKTTRSGGKALDFYCSIILKLVETGKLKRTIQGVERPVGVKVKVVCQKNKVGLPYRSCDYSIIFGYGIDDIKASVDWLLSIKADVPYEELGCKPTKIGVAGYCRRILDADWAEFEKARDLLRTIVQKKWAEVEQGFLPRRGKYKSQ